VTRSYFQIHISLFLNCYSCLFSILLSLLYHHFFFSFSIFFNSIYVIFPCHCLLLICYYIHFVITLLHVYILSFFLIITSIRSFLTFSFYHLFFTKMQKILCSYFPRFLLSTEGCNSFNFDQKKILVTNPFYNLIVSLRIFI